jgi:hypothetical protein
VIAKVWQMFPQKLEKLVECTVEMFLAKSPQPPFFLVKKATKLVESNKSNASMRNVVKFPKYFPQ